MPDSSGRSEGGTEHTSDPQPVGAGPTTGVPVPPGPPAAGGTAPRVTSATPKKRTTIWIVAGVVIALLLLCACIAISALFALVPSRAAEDGGGVETQNRGSLYIKPDSNFDTLLISGAESVAVGCVLYYNDTGQKPTIEGIEDALKPYVQPWPANPFTEQPLACGSDGVGCLEVKSLEAGLGPSSADVVRVMLSTGEWHQIEVPYP